MPAQPARQRRLHLFLLLLCFLLLFHFPLLPENPTLPHTSSASFLAQPVWQWQCFPAAFPGLAVCPFPSTAGTGMEAGQILELL